VSPAPRAQQSLPRSVRVFAPAKINWALTIRRKREDGFHDIDTVFQAVGIGDELLCRRVREATCRILCDDPAVPTGPENLIARAWALLRREHPERVGGVEVRLTKVIPMGAGLGGGSSDAAAALAAVDRLYGLGLSPTQRERHAALLGSDCAFFVRGGTALGSGRGELLRRIPNRLPRLWVVIVWPGFASLTGPAYAGITSADWRDGTAVQRAADAIQCGDLSVLQKSLTNVFSKVVLGGNSGYKFVQEHMRSCGLDSPLLSGSGAAMFAICTDRPGALLARAQLRKFFPWVAAVPLRRTGVGFKSVQDRKSS
jgi:4-diphosphocytidyl-2-C-methyl-D-erythritol kinase